MIGTQGKHNPESAGGLKRHEKINERSALYFAGFRQELLELVDDQQGFGLADRQVAADFVNIWAEQYIQENRESRVRTTQQTEDSLRAQLADFGIGPVGGGVIKEQQLDAVTGRQQLDHRQRPREE